LGGTTVYAQPLPGTKLLETRDDLARVMVEGIDRYLTKRTAESVARRAEYWKPDYTSAEAYEKSIAPNRERLRRILGVVDARVAPQVERFGSLTSMARIGVINVRWNVLPGVTGEGLLVAPLAADKVRARAVVIPDADQTPEMLAGLAEGLPASSQIARVLAENGVEVIVPALIDRKDEHSANPKIKRQTNQTHREFVYRMSYEMGRHVVGYEVQRVLAVVDHFAVQKKDLPIGVYGYGEGGLLALCSAALDTRIKAAVVSGHFGPREELHKEPIYRNVWGLLNEFGDAELMRLVVPRAIMIEGARFKTPEPPAEREGRKGAAPGAYETAEPRRIEREIERAVHGMPREFMQDLPRTRRLLAPLGGGQLGDAATYGALGEALVGIPFSIPPQGDVLAPPVNVSGERQKRQFDELVAFTQNLQRDAVHERHKHVWNKLDTSSLAAFEKSQEPVRESFWRDVMGKLPKPTMPLNPRTRLAFETSKWKAYDVVLDVYEDVISYGILLVPNDLKPGEKRPCVVCQHGLEGRPIDVVNPKEKTRAYNSYGAQLADKGFIVFAPQCPYIFKNEFRQVVRKANPLALNLYAFIIRQHERILEFLNTLPFVDGARIAYYGLSYGGKVAMRIPAILAGYAIVICSGDFNEWIWKNVTIDWGGSYMFTGEYEVYEFNLGNTFNYAEMAALICPRPFMVERGHNDGVGLDEYVAFEFAKVRRLYAKLGIADRTEIEFFQGGHEIHLVGTLAFLRKHLGWPR
jgi:cephalosporin-C deacetylase-like acetyl esterase